MGFITRETAALQSTHPTQNVKLIIRHYLPITAPRLFSEYSTGKHQHINLYSGKGLQFYQLYKTTIAPPH